MNYAISLKRRDDELKVGADLHLHTIASDGSWEPDELIHTAENIGLSTISITDHDTIDSILPAFKANSSNLEIIPGIEFSTEYSNTEIHILGYGIDINDVRLLNVLDELQKERIKRAIAIIERLNNLNLDIDYQTVKRLAGSGTIGRVHIAQALIEQGYTTSISEGFSQYLNRNAPAYVPRKKQSPHQAIAAILAVGGAPVLAHPGIFDNDDIIPELKSAGLVGLEIIHPYHSAEQIKHYFSLAQSFGLLPTGGSDCHGRRGKDRVYIGTIEIPDQWVFQLKSYLGI